MRRSRLKQVFQNVYTRHQRARRIRASPAPTLNGKGSGGCSYDRHVHTPLRSLERRDNDLSLDECQHTEKRIAQPMTPLFRLLLA